MQVEAARYRIVERADGSFVVQWLGHRWLDVYEAAGLADARRHLIAVSVAIADMTDA